MNPAALRHPASILFSPPRPTHPRRRRVADSGGAAAAGLHLRLHATHRHVLHGRDCRLAGRGQEVRGGGVQGCRRSSLPYWEQGWSNCAHGPRAEPAGVKATGCCLEQICLGQMLNKGGGRTPLPHLPAPTPRSCSLVQPGQAAARVRGAEGCCRRRLRRQQRQRRPERQRPQRHVWSGCCSGPGQPPGSLNKSAPELAAAATLGTRSSRTEPGQRACRRCVSLTFTLEPFMRPRRPPTIAASPFSPFSVRPNFHPLCVCFPAPNCPSPSLFCCAHLAPCCCQRLYHHFSWLRPSFFTPFSIPLAWIAVPGNLWWGHTPAPAVHAATAAGSHRARPFRCLSLCSRPSSLI